MNRFNKNIFMHPRLSGVIFSAALFLFYGVPGFAYAQSLPEQDEINNSTVFTLATGRPGSTHAQVGEILCNVYNRQRDPNSPLCRSIYSPGGRQQLADMLSNKVHMAIIQSDVVAAAYMGKKQFKTNDQLRVLLPLHDQVMAAVIKDSAANSRFDITSMLSKRVTITDSIRDGRFTLRRLFATMGPSYINENNIVEMTPADQAQAICDDRFDIGFMILGHPIGAIQQGIHDCELKLVPFDFPKLRAVVESSRYLNMGKIPKDTYTGQMAIISAPSVAALLVTTDRFNHETGLAFINILRDNQSILRRLHRSLVDLDLNRRPTLVRHMKLFGQD